MKMAACKLLINDHPDERLLPQKILTEDDSCERPPNTLASVQKWWQPHCAMSQWRIYGWESKQGFLHIDAGHRTANPYTQIVSSHNLDEIEFHMHAWGRGGVGDCLQLRLCVCFKLSPMLIQTKLRCVWRQKEFSEEGLKEGPYMI